MNLLAKIKSVASNPVMLASYTRWVVAKLFTGRSPWLALTDDTRIGNWLTFSEYWSFQNIMPEPERLFVERCLRNKKDGKATAFDVGANVGAFTCLMASMGPHQVHAFEPIPATFCRLNENVKANGLLDRCRLNCMAVGRGRDLVSFRIQEDSPATNRMAVPGEKPDGKGTSSQIVAAIGLDEYCESQNVGFIDFLKIDVEGMEPYVLQGARALLAARRIAAILIEICPGNLQAVGLSPADLYREFVTARYSPYALDKAGKPGTKLSLTGIEAISLANAVLLPDA